MTDEAWLLAVGSRFRVWDSERQLALRWVRLGFGIWDSKLYRPSLREGACRLGI